MAPMGCLCFCILQCAVDVRNISCCCESDRNGTNGFLERWFVTLDSRGALADSRGGLAVVISQPLLCCRVLERWLAVWLAGSAVASLTEMDPMGCLCFCTLQRAQGVRNSSCCCESDRNGPNGLPVLLYHAVRPRCAQQFLLLRVWPKWTQWVACASVSCSVP